MQMQIIRLLAAWLMLAVPGFAQQAVQINLQGLLGETAVIKVDGQREVVKAGEMITPQIKLLRVEQSQVVLVINGQQQILTLTGAPVTTQYNERRRQQHRVYRNTQGMYLAQGAINGQAIPVLVDTGAFSVAISQTTAQQLGLSLPVDRVIQVSTASGEANAYPVTFDSVSVGEITLTQVEGVIVEGDAPSHVLLGQTFLNQINISQQAGFMLLETR